MPRTKRSWPTGGASPSQPTSQRVNSAAREKKEPVGRAVETVLDDKSEPSEASSLLGC
ncbi:hypothetical protein CHELA1G2_11864 [Hyphomicrobiales bacterium]|nr:hypothetical protein CHELA1G2_11864 [Hyphomicrobiales bacterium]